MYIKVNVTPGSRREIVEKESNDHFAIRVKQEAKNNAVNKRLIEIFRQLYKDAKTIKIISGHRSPGKILSIEE